MSKVIVITGASGGLGSAIAGHHSDDIVCSLSLTNPQNYKNFYKCDVTDEPSVQAALSSVYKEFGGIDILYVNAGVGMAGAVELSSSEKFKSVCDINFYGAYHTMKHAVPYMGSGGRIIGISSVSGLFALPYRSAYTSSKAALTMLCFSLAMEVGKKGIFVTAICPGEIRTEFVANRVIDGGTDAYYGDGIEKMLSGIDKKQHTRMSVSYASGKIVKIAQKRRPKKFYIIGFKYKVYYFFSKVLPTNLFLKILQKYK